MDRYLTTLLLAMLTLCLLAAAPASAATLEDLMTDPVDDVIASATNETVDRPGIDILNVRVDDLSGDLEVSISLDGAHEVEASYTVNILVDGADLFTFSYTELGGFYALDPHGGSLTVLGWFDPGKAVWEVSTTLLSVATGLVIDSCYTYVTNSTGAVLEDSLDDPGPINDPPVVIVTFPSDGQTVSGTIDITGTASDDTAVMKVYFRIDRISWQVATGTDSWSETLDTTTLSDGSHYLEVQAFDSHTGSAIISLRFTVDNTVSDDPPVVHISWPVDHTVNGTISIIGTAADDGGVARVQVRIDGMDWLDATGTASWSYDYDTSALAVGKHTVEAIAFDQGDQASPVVTGVFWTSPDPPPENQPPSVFIDDPYVDEYIYRSRKPYMFMGSAKDDVEVVYVEIRLNGAGTWMKAQVSEGCWSLELDLRPLGPNSKNFIEARASDGSLHSSIVRVDFEIAYNTEPWIGITILEDSLNSQRIEGWSIDDIDDIVSIEVRLDTDEWKEVSFYPNDSDPKGVVFFYNISVPGMTVDIHELTFRSYDGYDHSDEVTHEFIVKKKRGGLNPRLPGPGPFMVLLAMVVASMVLYGRTRPGHRLG